MLEICPVCNQGIKFTQGFTWLNGKEFFEHNCEKINDKKISCHSVGCYLCNSDDLGKCGLLWVGKRFYTPEAFIKESLELGVSKRIAHIPREIELGKTVVFLAHKEDCNKEIETNGSLIGKKETKVPGIFFAFIPKKIEKIITETQSKNEKLIEDLKKKNITLIVVPNDDPDHQGTVYDKEQEE